ncbi:MAG TPA: hypothetical protein VF898_04515 [Chloroflexota bacterium]
MPAPTSTNGDESWKWRRLPTHVGASQRHVALSDALSRAVSTPSIWWHSTTRETLILGAGQNWTDVDLKRCRDQNVLVLKRRSGGTTVYAGSGVWGLDIAIPAGSSEWRADILEAYRWTGELWVETLKELGVDARMASVAEARSNSSDPDECSSLVSSICFANVSPYEIFVNSRKLVGFAQIRRSSAYVVQSGIHVQFPSARVARLMQTSDPEALAACVQNRVIGLAELVPFDPEIASVRATFERTLTRRSGRSIALGEWSAAETAQADEAHLSYAPS